MNVGAPAPQLHGSPLSGRLYQREVGPHVATGSRLVQREYEGLGLPTFWNYICTVLGRRNGLAAAGSRLWQQRRRIGNFVFGLWRDEYGPVELHVQVVVVHRRVRCANR